MRRSFPALGLFVLASCAVVEAPSGGPEDKTSPVVMGVFPAPAQREVPTDVQPVLQFSEWIQSTVPRGAIVLSPPQAKRLRWEAEADRLRILPGGSLDSATTYTLTVNTAIKDLRGNPLAKPFQLAFSTGTTLDSLSLQGRVLFSKGRTVPTVGLYSAGPERLRWQYLARTRDSALSAAQDTVPAPQREIPLFVAATDSVGRFAFGGLPAGRYRLAAFIDGNGNTRMDPQVEEAGLGEGDIELRGPDSTTLHYLALGDLDDTPMRLESYGLRTQGQLELSFNRLPAQDTLWQDTANCALWTPDSSKRFAPSHIWFDPASRRPVLYFPQGPQEDSLYVLHCAQARDSLGRALDTLQASLRLRWELPSDTGEARLIHMQPRTGATQVPLNDTLWLTFSKSVNLADWADRFRLVSGSDTLAHTVWQPRPVQIAIAPTEPFPLDGQVKLLRLSVDTTLRRNDSTGTMDTVRQTRRGQVLQFSTRERLKIAELRGTIPGGNARTRVSLRNLQVQRVHEAQCNDQGAFALTDLVAGPHLLRYWEDRNGDGKHSPGALTPWQHAEPIRIPADTLQLPRGASVLDSLVRDLVPLP